MARALISESVLQPMPSYLQAVTGANVQVNQRAGGAATVYQAAAGGGTWANPLTTRNGKVEPNEAAGGEPWLDTGSYDLVVSIGGTSVYTARFEAVNGSGSVDAGDTAGGDLSGTYPNPVVAKASSGLVVTGALVRPTIVTSLPGSPVDGQECFFLADDTWGIVWHLRYRAGSASAYKWEFVSGSPLGAQQPGLVSTTNIGYVTLAPSVQLTVPLAGDYHIAHGVGQIENTAAAYSQVQAYVAGSGIGVVLSVWGNTGSGVAPGAIEWLATALAAGTLIEQRYQTASAGTAKFTGRWMNVRPVRVG